MAEDTRANKEAEEDAQPEPMPSSDQQAADSVKSDVAAPSEEVSTQVKADDELQLPEGAPERTREEFDKLKQRNKRLKEELERKKRTESVFDSMRPQPEPAAPPAVSPEVEQFIDPQTGYVDVGRLNQAMTQQRQEIAATRQQIQQYVEAEQEREAYKTYPELNPKVADKFDDAFYRRTRAVLMDSMVNPQDYGNRALTLKEAADEAKGSTGKVVEKAKKEGAKEAMEKLTPKEQASLEATGRSDRRAKVETGSSSEDLSVRTRYGDKAAIAERLSKIPPTRGYASPAE